MAISDLYNKAAIMAAFQLTTACVSSHSISLTYQQINLLTANE
jgi:hypothetical protein